ncbi:MAG: cation:proton antiporter [Acidobacteriaceae bacterium]|nr:cation:proton antiporter [Acidobacteriaceae bacterium]
MTQLLLEMTVVLLVTLACGALSRKLGQARVIGEIIGGILLGPSLFGRLAPHTAAWLFPPQSLAPFDTLSTVGLILFLFVIGSELNFEHLQKQRGTALFASSLSILLPFSLAALFAHAIRVRFAPNNVGSLPFVLFLGVSMSITAFPVLARILEERRLQGTSLGVTAILCAAVDDVSAWTLLAAALTLIPHRGGDGLPLSIRLVGLLIYLLLMLGAVRPLIHRVTRRLHDRPMQYELLGVIVALVLASAAATEWLGVHPLFGAFIAGCCFPRVPAWQHEIRSRLDMLVSVLLLPFFFALTGMRTRFDLLNSPRVWGWTAVILVIAVAGKIGGAALGARLTKQSWRDALALGALLNTRGLVELIVLNVAYKVGIFSPTLFTMLVVMALLTTMLTSPMLDLLKVRPSESLPPVSSQETAGFTLEA